MEEQFAGRVTERVIGVLVPDLGMLGTIIYHDIDNDSA
jgi:hypothetical protein